MFVSSLVFVKKIVNILLELLLAFSTQHPAIAESLRHISSAIDESVNKLSEHYSSSVLTRE